MLGASTASSAADDNSRALEQFIRGTVAAQTGDHYRAAFHYQQALRYDSLSAYLHVALAQEYLLLGNSGQADDQLNQALQLDPKSIPALELKVVILRGTGKPEKSREYLQRLSQAAPRNSRYLREMLAMALAQGDFAQADRLYQRTVEVEGETDQLMKQVLTVYLMNDQPKRAIPLLLKLHERDTSDAAITFSLGTTYMQVGDTAKGERLMWDANRMVPSEPRYWIGLSVLALDHKQYQQAAALADSGLARHGPDAGLYSIQGTALNRLGKATDAAAVLEKAIALDSTLFTAMGTLALIYDGLDSLTRVEELYERAIRLSDSAAVYLNNLAYAYAQRGVQLDQAKALASEALRRDPKNASYGLD
jgi:tetratricopeptide (TPR) repeat protein